MEKENYSQYNLIMIPNFVAPLDKIIEDYAAMSLDCKTLDEVISLFWMYHEEISAYIGQALLIDEIEQKVEMLKEINNYIDDED